MKLITWNINSVRIRLDHIARVVADEDPDVLCLQEIKCQPAEFPRAAFEDMGLGHLHICGQKGWHGVATASKHPITPLDDRGTCREGQARHAISQIKGLEVHNLYCPAGGDVPDPQVNPKFDHKLDVFARLTQDFGGRPAGEKLVVLGDLNIAPGEHDVWNHKYMLKVVSHTPPEIESMGRLMASYDFLDMVRHHTPAPEKLFSWWSYRAKDFRASNRGLRLDHVLVSPALAPAAKTGRSYTRDDVRGWDKPSDHAPVVAVLDV